MKVLLICASGMSTSLLVEKIKSAATQRNIDLEIEAIAANLAEEKSKNYDIVLLGPQVSYLKGRIEGYVEGKIPVQPIDMRMYGRMDGVGVLDSIIKSLNK